jgi:hypothetical protein
MLFIGVATHFAFVLCGLAGILLHASRLKSHFNSFRSIQSRASNGNVIEHAVFSVILALRYETMLNKYLN